MRIAIGGNYKIACEAITYLLEIGILKENILICINKKDQGINTWQPSLKYKAEKLGFKIVKLEELYPIKNLVFFSLEFDQIIKTQKFNSQRLFNIHFSLLPKYKGMYTSCLPLLNGEDYAGVTLHKMDDGIDTGEIISQISFPIPLELNAYGLYSEFMNHAVKIFKNNIEDIISDNFKSTPQEVLNSSYFSKNSIDFSNIEINFRQTAYQVHNQVRAFTFRPFQLVKIENFPVSHSMISINRSESKPGTFVETSPYMRIYSTIDYDVIIYFDQLEEILKASQENNLNFIQRKFQDGYSLTEKNSRGWDALIVAAYHNSIDVLKFLLEKGVDPNSFNNNGTSVLMYAMTQAVSSNDFRSMEVLINEGADVNHFDYSGKSLIEYAEEYGNISVLQFLNRL
jgi:methionyl-tRNA formyltransferase